MNLYPFLPLALLLAVAGCDEGSDAPPSDSAMSETSGSVSTGSVGAQRCSDVEDEQQCLDASFAEQTTCSWVERLTLADATDCASAERAMQCVSISSGGQDGCPEDLVCMAEQPPMFYATGDGSTTVLVGIECGRRPDESVGYQTCTPDVAACACACP